MKKYIKHISLLALFATFSSCTTTVDQYATTPTGGNVLLTDTKISRLDTNNDIALQVVTKSGVTATKIEIFNNIAASTTAAIILGNKIADGTLTSATAATFSSSTISGNANFASNQATATGAIQLAFVTTYSDGTTTTSRFAITIARGINFVNSDGIVISSTGINNVKYLDPSLTNNIISYKVYKKYAATVVDNVTVEWKKNLNGTYAPVTGTFPITNGSIDLGTIPYADYGLAVGDDLYYRFTVTSGTQKDYIETFVTVTNQVLNSSKSANLYQDLTANKFSFQTGMNYADTDTTHGEIVFTSPFGIAKEVTTSINFVKVNNPSTTYYTDTDLFMADADYNAGTKVTSLTNLASDDVIIYKVTRNINTGTVDTPVYKDFTYYGLLKIGAKTSDNSTTSFMFDYKEGILLK